MLCQDKICLLWACQCIALTKSEANIWNHVVCEYARLGYYSYNYWQNMNQTWLLWSHSSAFCQYISEVVFAIISFEKHGSNNPQQEVARLPWERKRLYRNSKSLRRILQPSSKRAVQSAVTCEVPAAGESAKGRKGELQFTLDDVQCCSQCL